MPSIPSGHALVTLEFAMPHVGGTRTAVTTFGIFAETSLSLCDEIADAYSSEVWLDLGSNQVTFSNISIVGETLGYELARNVVGGHSGEIPPPNTSLLVRKLTGIRGRTNQGRMFPPGLVYEGTYNNSGQMSSTDRNEYQTKFTGFLEALEALSAPMVLFHGNEDDPTPVSSLFVEATAATQRRRLR